MRREQGVLLIAARSNHYECRNSSRPPRVFVLGLHPNWSTEGVPCLEEFSQLRGETLIGRWRRLALFPFGVACLCLKQLESRPLAYDPAWPGFLPQWRALIQHRQNQVDMLVQ